MSLRLALALAATGLLAISAQANWTHFRGSKSNGTAAEPVPQEFGEGKNVAWKVPLPGRGLSSPIVVGDKLFLTASTGTNNDRLHVLAFDAGSGKQLWERSFWATGPTASHPKTNMAAPTPASDGKHVVALFATDDLVCLDLDGNVKWVRSLYEENQGATDGRGLASSPIIINGTIVVQIDTQNVAFCAGVDITTGANRWRKERAKEINWSSPIILPGRNPGEELALIQGSKKLAAVDPQTGAEIWALEMECDPIASSVVAGKVLYVPAGEKGMTAFELQGASPPKQLWQQRRIVPVTSSPVVVKDRIYCVRGGRLVSADIKNGEPAGNLRLSGAISSSLVVAGGLIYCFDEQGTAFVIQPDEKDGKLLQKNTLGKTPPASESAAAPGAGRPAGDVESILCTPALANGAMYVRSDKHLWKIAKGS